jgi:hypothetical protein
MITSMNEEKMLAIVANGEEERRALTQLFASEGFPVEAYRSVDDFEQRGETSALGCLIVDLDHSEGELLVEFATEWSRKLPVVVIASEEGRLPQDPLLPTLSRQAGDSRLLYLVYGAMGEPEVQGILCGSPLWLRRA